MKEEKDKSVLYLSDKFKSILEKIQNKGNSLISKKLLELNGDNKNTFDVTYIDRTDNDNMVSFISSNNLNRVDGSYWDNNRRQETRIGRIIRRIFGTKFDQRSIELFVNKYKSIIRIENDYKNFDIVKGEDIRHWYLHRNYDNRRGTLGGSCMAGRDAQRFFDIYTNNENQISLCILKNENGDKIKGRAIVWNLTEPEGYVFMDRIYTNDDADMNLFLEFAKENGWYSKKRQSYRGDDLITPNGDEIKDKDLLIELENTNFNRYPYMDTMRYYYRDEGILCNTRKKGDDYITLNDTAGYYDEYDGDYEPVLVVDWRGNEINEDDAVWCEYDNQYCLTNESIRVRKGEHGRGIHFLPNSNFLKFSNYSDSYYHRDDVVYSDYMKDWIYKKYAVKMYLDKNKNEWVWNHRLTLHDDMGKVDDDYYTNDILYREQIEKENGEIILGDYHFKDEDFENLPIDDKDEYFGDVPDGVDLDK